MNTTQIVDGLRFWYGRLGRGTWHASDLDVLGELCDRAANRIEEQDAEVAAAEARAKKAEARAKREKERGDELHNIVAKVAGEGHAALRRAKKAEAERDEARARLAAVVKACGNVARRRECGERMAIMRIGAIARGEGE